jgi:hypothetical protein
MAQIEIYAQNYKYFQVCYFCLFIFIITFVQIDDGESDIEDDDASRKLISPIHKVHSTK